MRPELLKIEGGNLNTHLIYKDETETRRFSGIIIKVYDKFTSNLRLYQALACRRHSRPTTKGPLTLHHGSPMVTF